MNITLSDNNKHLCFAPLTLTRPIAELRVGIWTNTERYKHFAELEGVEINISFETELYLGSKYPSISDRDLWINSSFIPSKNDFKTIINLKDGEELYCNETIIAKRKGNVKSQITQELQGVLLNKIWNLFQYNDIVLENDFNSLDLSKSQSIDSCGEFNRVLGNRLFIEKGAKINDATINTLSGPVYIGENVEIMEGSVIRGGLAMLNNSVLKLSTKIYGATTIGPYCKIGGEVNNSIFIGYSNKGHDGFMGNSLIGEWCNFGADTNTSNLKNNYSNVRAYSYESNDTIETDVTFMGLVTGDHCKSAINTMFNTATVLGVNVNIVSGEFPPKYIPSFTWHINGENSEFKFEKATDVANKMMERRELKLSEVDSKILSIIQENK
jgi:UDP-N-acetylglucosamine diphosphorylase/glucosamine-1-phosphate N-acetyltransferase